MRASPMAEFSVNEYAQRMEGLVRELRARGMDGALISSRENTRYFCGLQSIIWSSKVSTPGILLVNADGAHELIGSASSVETARYTSVIDDGAHSCFNRNGLPGVPATYPQAIAAAFRKLKLERGRVGMELGEGAYLQLQLQWFEQLAGLLPGRDVRRCQRRDFRAARHKVRGGDRAHGARLPPERGEPPLRLCKSRARGAIRRRISFASTRRRPSGAAARMCPTISRRCPLYTDARALTARAVPAAIRALRRARTRRSSPPAGSIRTATFPT